jgi:shikimate dehydrogenase
MHKLAVFGNPIKHSLSPTIFELFAKQFDIRLSYEKILAYDNEDFKYKISEFFADGGDGVSVTSPFKQAAYSWSSIHTKRAAFCQASNFIYLNDLGQIIADATDGIGLVTDLEQNLNIKIKGKKILIIGSGYVLDSILLDLIVLNPMEIDILARNHKRIEFLADKFATGIFNVNKKYDLIINATPNTLDNILFNELTTIVDGGCCYDMTYSGSKSFFHEKTMQLNPNCFNYIGLGMLVEQAKISFINLFNQVPETKSVLQFISTKTN